MVTANRIRLLDGWRGMAIIAVLIGHFMPVPFINAGRFGVEMFFVLSGRLMGEILFVRNTPLGEFYWRRVTRIVPALYVFLLAILVAFPLLPGLPEASRGTLLVGATFTYNYLHGSGFGLATLDHLWSLCIEEHTYIILGLVACLFAARRNAPWQACFTLAALCMAHGIYLTVAEGQDYYSAYWRTDTRATGILLGCGLHCLNVERPRLLAWLSGRTTGLLLLLALTLSLYPVSDCLKYTLGTFVLALCVVAIDRLPALLHVMLLNRIVAFAGVASFSIYLYQQPFYQVTAGWRPLMLVPAVLCGLLSYFLIERPFRRILNGLYSPPLRTRTA